MMLGDLSNPLFFISPHVYRLMEGTDGFDRILTIVKRKTQMGDVEKNCVMNVILQFASEVMDVKYHIGDNTMQIVLTSNPGNPAWMHDNVFRYEDGVGVRSDARMKERATHMVQLFKEAGGTDQMGWMVFLELLDRMYMDYDMWVI